jgi:ABC-type uncharacterized transport system substrate-binding protein
MTNWKSVQLPRPSGNRMRRRELMLVAGGAVMTPHVLFAEQKAMPVIGFLSSASPGPFSPFVAAFHQGLSDTGYIEGQNLAIEYRWAEGHYDRLSDLAIDLVHSGVEVIATSGGDTVAGTAKGATGAIPIVFTSGGDPHASRGRHGRNAPHDPVVGQDQAAEVLEVRPTLRWREVDSNSWSRFEKTPSKDAPHGSVSFGRREIPCR